VPAPRSTEHRGPRFLTGLVASPRILGHEGPGSSEEPG
jgi:hypothetical protein